MQNRNSSNINKISLIPIGSSSTVDRSGYTRTTNKPIQQLQHLRIHQ